MSESEFVNSLHINQRKTYWKLKDLAIVDGAEDKPGCASVNGSARSIAIKVVNAAEHAKKRGEDRCPYCQTVWVSSIDFRERHDLECPLPEARQVLNAQVSRPAGRKDQNGS